MVNRAITLTLPDGVSPEVYARVRVDSTLGAALDKAMIPALENAGDFAKRVAAFTSARDHALDGYTETPTAAEAASTATGPMTPPGRAAFNKVSTDVLRACFIQTAEAVAASQEPLAKRLAMLVELEREARAAFAWAPGTAESIAVRVMLVRRGLEQRAAP